MVSRWRRRTATEIRSGDKGGFVAACFDVMQRLQTNLPILLCLPHTSARCGHRDPSSNNQSAVARELLDLGAGFFLQVQKADNDVRNLHAGIVDIVLYIHFPAGKTQQANEGVAQDGIAQVADMRGLVGINAGMLNQNLPGGLSAAGFCPPASSAASSWRFNRALM